MSESFEYNNDGMFDENKETTGKSGACIAGFVMSLVGIITCGLTALPGLICSIVGLAGLKKYNKSGKGFGIAGVIIGGIQTIVGLVIIVAYMSYSIGLYRNHPELVEEFRTSGTFSDDTIESFLVDEGYGDLVYEG